MVKLSTYVLAKFQQNILIIRYSLPLLICPMWNVRGMKEKTEKEKDKEEKDKKSVW